MNILVFVSLGLIAVSAILHIVNDFFAVGIAVILSAILYLGAAQIFLPKSRGLVAGLLALGISSVYSSLYLWLLNEDFGLTSDAALYDRLARDIANTIPLLSQMNPFSFGYVYDLGYAYAAISQPGYYKILGFCYTLGELLGVNTISVQVPLTLNLLSFSLIGYMFYMVIEPFQTCKKNIWILWSAFIFTPYLLEMLVLIRKDIFLLMVSLLAVNVIRKKRHFLLVIFALAVIATLRMPQAVLIFVFYLIYEALTRELVLVRVFEINSIFLVSLIGVLVFMIAAYSPMLDVSPESMVALMDDQAQVGFGFSSLFLTNYFGVALYAILYPFPSLLPQSFDSLINTVFSCIRILIIIVLICNINNMRRCEPFVLAVSLVVLIAFAAHVLSAIISWKYFGFVVIESRYKLLDLPLVFICFCGLLQSRERRVLAN